MRLSRVHCAPIVTAAFASLIASAAFLAWLAFSWGGERVTLGVDDFGLIAAPALALAGCIRAARRCTGRNRAVWVLLGSSALSWGLGEVAWTRYEFFLKTAPFPSVADVGFLLAVPFSAAALLVHGIGRARSATLAKTILDGLIVSLSLLMVSWVLVLRPIVRAGGDSMLVRSLTIAYPGTDVVVMALVVFGLSRARSRAKSVILLLGAGLAAISLADSAFSYFNLIGDYHAGAYADVGWFGGFLLVMLASFRAEGDDEAGENPVPSRVSVLLPYIPVGLASIVAVFELARSARFDRLLWSVGVALFTVVVFRQLATLLEHVGLVRDLETRVETRTGELRLATVALGQRERHFRSLVQNASDLIIVAERDGTVTYASPSAERLLGRDADELVGQPLMSLLHPDDAELLRGLHVAADARRGASMSVEWRMAHADSTWRVLDTTVTNQVVGEGSQVLVLNSRDVTERKGLEEQLRHAAFHDALTGLPNRALFRDRLDQALAILERETGVVAVLFLDLDDFKVVNDTAGHHAGDALLGAVAARFSSVVRPGDTVARLGGDEFAVLLTNLRTAEEAATVAAKLQAQLATPVNVEGTEVDVHTSIGIAVATTAGCSADDLVRHADVAMYVAKSEGKRTHRFYEPAMHAALVERMELQAALALAIDHDEFAVHYQPIVSLANQEMVGVEALLRWQHPTFGAVGPADFIPLAEQTGLIVPIGEWVLDTVCRQVSDWARLGLGTDLEVSVNLSARQLIEPGLADYVGATLYRHGVAPAQLVLEITETILMEDMDSVLRTVEDLRALGIRLAIDDFGTGYSSLAYLTRLPVQILKIDRAFIVGAKQDRSAQAMLESILRLASDLDLATVAEGIEDEDTADELRVAGCTMGQGYWFSRPVPADQLLALLSRHTLRLPVALVGV